MPNWVKNNIYIESQSSDIKKVADRIIITEDYLKSIDKRNENLSEEFKFHPRKLGEISFDRLIPVPTDIFQLPLKASDEAKYGADKCWYQWNIDHWGTKWDACEVSVQVSENVIELVFETAWSCPLEYIEALGKVCVENHCDMYGSFADEDYGGCMGNFGLTDDGEVQFDLEHENEELYESLWGFNPLSDE